ncbi:MULTISPECIES: TetR/AcrR family transcriptional regulator [Bacillaceae]|uniref:TetR/AcrR family transcriptional regulator n=1 Tax=Evansella alkalicola TaxID=745819 RepID=A0ABS6JY84_9BACI|nr:MULTISPECIES: TetR/AcrR family transcriptional regulator [Bacillaceae]MBU9723544.1 TetR/AcrR family transcriptional regulator [Bacillus alkalicola]
MPPKAEITREKIIDAGFRVVREDGLGELSARNIAKKLNCSTQPIYSLFKNMGEMKDAVYERVIAFQRQELANFKSDHQSKALNLAVGILQFAKNEKQLFRTIYLSGHKTYNLHEEEFIGEALTLDYLRESSRVKFIDEQKQRQIFLSLTIYLIGIGTMINTETLDIGIEEGTEMIREMYEALLLREMTQSNN